MLSTIPVIYVADIREPGRFISQNMVAAITVRLTVQGSKEPFTRCRYRRSAEGEGVQNVDRDISVSFVGNLRGD